MLNTGIPPECSLNDIDHTTAREITTSTHEPESNDGTPSATAVDPESEERAASPPLSRRVTGFFAKKIPSYNKKHQKANDNNKAGEEHAATDAPDATAAAAPVATAAVQQQAPSEEAAANKDAVAAATAATGVTDTETTTNKDASPAPVTTSA